MLTELITRRGPITPATFDAESRTFEAVISTGAPVRRRDVRGVYIERLDLTAIDPDSLAGLPVLDGHRQIGSEHVIGRIIAARHEGANLVAVIQLSAAENVRDVVTKVAEGTLRGVSIGYGEAGPRRETVDPETRERTITIQPIVREASLVAIPADPAAIIRSETMPLETENLATAPDHRAAVRTLARSAGLSAEWADSQIDAGADITAVRAAAFDELQGRGAIQIRTQTTQANDDPAVILERRAAAVFARVTGEAPDDAVRPFMADRLVDHARAMLTMRGVSVAGMDNDQLFRAAMHTTSDFPNLLTSVGNRTLMPAYQASQSPLKMLARQALLNDFRAASRLKLGEIGQLQKVSEAGEIKSTSRSEAAESYALDTYGSMFAISRKALINDDLGAFRDWGQAAGRAAADTEAQLLFDLLTAASGAGPTMGEDGKALFHADHDNLGTAADVGTDALDVARIAMRTRKGLDGETLISAAPKYLLVGPAKESTGETLMHNINAGKIADVNPFSGKFTLLVEPRIADDAWYLFADPAILPVLEYAYLSSAQGPQLASREGWDVLGMEFRVTLDFGCGAVDWRGAYRNPGA